jgi:hypothetical protein
MAVKGVVARADDDVPEADGDVGLAGPGDEDGFLDAAGAGAAVDRHSRS